MHRSLTTKKNFFICPWYFVFTSYFDINTSNQDKLKNYPDFEILYKEIEQECYEFDNDINREYYKNKFFPKEKIKKLKQLGYSDNMIEKKKKNFFKYTFITDNVGKTTK